MNIMQKSVTDLLIGCYSKSAPIAKVLMRFEAVVQTILWLATFCSKNEWRLRTFAATETANLTQFSAITTNKILKTLILDEILGH